MGVLRRLWFFRICYFYVCQPEIPKPRCLARGAAGGRELFMEEKRKSDRIWLIVMIVLIVLLLPLLCVNLTLIIKGSVHPETPPDIFGIAPLAVTSGSMDGEEEDSFAEDALIFVTLLNEDELQTLTEGDVITFKTDDIYVTHRIVSIFRDESGAAVSFVTKGDANATEDGAVELSSVVGKCVASVGGLGGFAIFMQTPAGVLVFVGIPVLLYVAYDVTRIVLHNKRVKAEKSKDIAEKDAEIERLRALVGEQAAQNQESVPAETGTREDCGAKESESAAQNQKSVHAETGTRADTTGE